MTSLDHLFSGTSLEGLGRLVKEKGVRALPGDMKVWLPDNDVSLLQEIFGLPAWLAKRFPLVGKVFDREQQRRAESSQIRAESLRDVESFMKLSSGATTALKDVLWGRNGIEGQKLAGVTEDRFVPAKDADGKPIQKNGQELDINPAHYEQFAKVFRSQFDEGGLWTAHRDVADELTAAYVDVRRMLDRKLLDIYDLLRANRSDDPGAIEHYRNFISMKMHNYFPHNRYGKYFIKAVDEFGNTIHREHFDLNTQRLRKGKRRALEAEAARRREAIAAKLGDRVATWETGENRSLPEDVYSFPIPVDAMEQIMLHAEKQIDEAALARIAGKNMSDATKDEVIAASKKMKEAIAGLMPKAVADTLKERGFMMHSMQRDNIPGFEQDDIKRVLYDYISGFSGWTTKISAARDFTKLMGKLDAIARPREYRYVTQYIQDMLRNSDDIDRLTGNVKALLFANYLGANLKTAILNLTQNVILGVPRLAQDVGAGQAMRWYKDAGKTLVAQIRDGKGLTEDQNRMLKELLDRGITDARYLHEIRGQISNLGLSAVWEKTLNWMGMPMAWSDRFNRASLALSAYDAARAGKIVNAKTLKKFGLARGEQATHDQATQFAADVATDAHFVYGKSNAPALLRNSAVGRAISPIYTFRTFTHNLLSAWHHMLTQAGPDGRKAFLLSLAGTASMGGLASMPFYASLLALWNAGMGEDDDPVAAVRKLIPEVAGDRPNLLRDMATYGLPAAFGVNLGGSIRLETPMLPNLQPGDKMADAATNLFKDALGVPWDFFIERPSRVVDSLRSGDTLRAVEDVVPFVVKNMLQAYRFSTEGATSLSGRPIALPGETEARKLDAWETAGKAVGFQPLASTKAWDLHSSLTRSQSVKQVQQSKFMNRLTRAIRSKDQAEIKKITDEIVAWNQRALERGEVYKIIRREDINRALQSRERPRGYSRALRPEVAERTALYQ